MRQWHFIAHDPHDTDRLAALFAKFVRSGTVIGLVGTLGTGKTHFVRGLAAAMGVPSDLVVSPTFVLCQQYDSNPTIYHYDAFRLRDPNDFIALGTDDILSQSGVALIEWSDQVQSVLPADRLEIHFRDIGATARDIELVALGGRSEELLDAVAQAMAVEERR